MNHKKKLDQIIEYSKPIFEYDGVDKIRIDYTISQDVNTGGAIPLDGKGEYLDLGLRFQDEISLFKRINDVISLYFSDSSLFNNENTFKLIINKDLSYEFKHFYDETLDEKNEAETRESIGDALYEKLKEEQRNFKEVEEEPIFSVDSLAIDQLFEMIRDELVGSLPKNWDKLILKTSIGKEGEQQLIETHFFYEIDGKQTQFDPENHYAPMNVLLRIEEEMAKEGNGWNESTIIIHRNGGVEFFSEFI